MDKVIDILTSYKTPKKVVAIGNEAVARGALEAGVNGVFHTQELLQLKYLRSLIWLIIFKMIHLTRILIPIW